MAKAIRQAADQMTNIKIFRSVASPKVISFDKMKETEIGLSCPFELVMLSIPLCPAKLQVNKSSSLGILYQSTVDSASFHLWNGACLSPLFWNHSILEHQVSKLQHSQNSIGKWQLCAYLLESLLSPPYSILLSLEAYMLHVPGCLTRGFWLDSVWMAGSQKGEIILMPAPAEVVSLQQF